MRSKPICSNYPENTLSNKRSIVILGDWIHKESGHTIDYQLLVKLERKQKAVNQTEQDIGL